MNLKFFFIDLLVGWLVDWLIGWLKLSPRFTGILSIYP